MCLDQPHGINSMDDLTDYDFIGLVKIVNEKTQEDSDYDTHVNILDIEIIEHFKGEQPRKIKEYHTISSCDIGIEVGEEWILFAFKGSSGMYSVGACERNTQYKDIEGQRYARYSRGIAYLEKLKELYGKTESVKRNGSRVLYYPNGKKEIEEKYRKMKLHGARKVWYPNGKLMIDENYSKGKKEGKATYYFSTGQIESEYYYSHGDKRYLSRIYYDTTYHKWEKRYLLKKYKTEEAIKSAYSQIQVWHETIYDEEGKKIIKRGFRRNGKIKDETLYFDDLKKFITYHENGNIEHIYYYKNGKPFGKYLSYFDNGLLNESNCWEYDSNGKKIK